MPHPSHPPPPPVRLLRLDHRPTPDDLRPPPGAVYTAMRLSADGRIPGLTAHLDRTWASAAALGWTPQRSRGDLRALLRTIAGSPEPCTAALLLDLHPDGGGVLARWPRATPVTSGARIARARPGAARAVAAAKDSAWRAARRAWETDPTADDHLLEGADGALLEGFTSTLLFVRGDRVFTHGAGALPGVTRALLSGPFAALGLHLQEGPTFWRDLPRTTEVGLASALRGLRPVVQVGDHRVGDGRPGPLLAAAHHALERRLHQIAEAP